MSSSETANTEGSTALIIVDIQPDFLPGGALPCEQAHLILEPLQDWITSSSYDIYVATQDWHPANHMSFASQHPGRSPFDVVEMDGADQVLWPNHCVAGTPGAALHSTIDWRKMHLIIRKGTYRSVDSYSAFQENPGAQRQGRDTGLGAWLKARGVTEVHVAGLARDFCVLWTALDAVRLGFKVGVLWNLTAPVSHKNDDLTLEEYQRAGVRIIT